MVVEDGAFDKFLFREESAIPRSGKRKAHTLIINLLYENGASIKLKKCSSYSSSCVAGMASGESIGLSAWGNSPFWSHDSGLQVSPHSSTSGELDSPLTMVVLSTSTSACRRGSNKALRKRKRRKETNKMVGREGKEENVRGRPSSTSFLLPSFDDRHASLTLLPRLCFLPLCLVVPHPSLEGEVIRLDVGRRARGNGDGVLSRSPTSVLVLVFIPMLILVLALILVPLAGGRHRRGYSNIDGSCTTCASWASCP